MKRLNLILFSVLASGLGAACISNDALAQGGRPSDPEKFYRAPNTIHGKTVLLPMNSHFEGRMNETISSKTRQGQKFSIEITSPVLANATDVVIPNGSRIIGEVVEAIPSTKQRKVKDQPKPLGKLRTQLTSLVTPDGMSYPLVASIMPEYTKSGKKTRLNAELNTPSMGYVGSPTSFDAVHPGFDTRGGNRGPRVMNKRDFMRDPILGNSGSRNPNSQYGTGIIRSIVRKGNEIYIYAGSPLTVRLDAPLKLAVAPSKGAISIDLDEVTPSLEDGTTSGNFRRFQPATRANPAVEEQAQPQAAAPVQPPEPDDGLPAFLRNKKKPFNPGASVQEGMQQGSAPQNYQQGGPPPNFQKQAPPDFQQQQPPPNFQQQNPAQQGQAPASQDAQPDRF